MSKKKSSRKIWENRVKKTSSRQSKGWKVAKHPQIEMPQMGKFEHILDNAGSGCGGKSGGGGAAGTLATPLIDTLTDWIKKN